MDPRVVVLLSFAALAAVVAAVGLLLRDLFFGGRRSAKSGAVGRRLPLARDERPATSLVGVLDESLSRLVLETDLGWSPMTAVLLLLACGLLAAGGFFVWKEDLLLAAIAAIIGAALPLAFLIYRRARRTREIQAQIPDALDLLARAVRAGQSLDQALALVGDKAAEPLAIEFRRASKQMHLGLSLSAAMRAFAHRLRLLEVRMFATTLAVHRQSGGNLGLTLERMAAVMRERAVYRRQVRAATAAGRFSALLISATGPLLFAYMFLFQPEYAHKLIQLPLGQTLLITAVVLEITGLIWIMRMLRTEV